jgi:polyphosphate glucokinase
LNILGVDIGGSGVKGAPVNIETGELAADRHRIPTPSPATPKSVAKTLSKLTKHFDWSGPMGCGFPAVIHHGVAKTASNIDKEWIGTNVIQLFESATGCPLNVVNDADAAGIAEVAYGAGRGIKGIVLMLTVGTGIGSALFVDGKLLQNTEFGHFHLNGKIAEKYAADAVRKKEDLSWKKWAKRFNEYLNHVESLIWPDLIIIGGGVSKKFEKYAKHLHTETPVVPAELLNHAGIIGAALAAKKLAE